MNKIIYIFITLSLLSFLSCEDAAEAEVTTIEREAKSQKVLKIGIVPQYASKRILSIWAPIVEELEAITGYTIEIVGTSSIPNFEGELAKGVYDIAYCNPYHSVIANKEQGYEALLSDGSKKLFGVLVVRKDDNIKDMAELNGETIAFPAPNALGASLLMRTELKQLYNLDIQPLYVKTHTNVYLNVMEGTTRAGGGVMRTFNELNDEIKGKLQIFHTTQKVPSHPIVLHPRLDSYVKASIKSAFLKLGETEKGKAMLSKIPINKIAETSQSEYDVLKNMGMEDFYVK